MHIGKFAPQTFSPNLSFGKVKSGIGLRSRLREFLDKDIELHPNLHIYYREDKGLFSSSFTVYARVAFGEEGDPARYIEDLEHRIPRQV